MAAEAAPSASATSPTCSSPPTSSRSTARPFGRRWNFRRCGVRSCRVADRCESCPPARRRALRYQAPQVAAGMCALWWGARRSGGPILAPRGGRRWRRRWRRPRCLIRPPLSAVVPRRRRLRRLALPMRPDRGGAGPAALSGRRCGSRLGDDGCGVEASWVLAAKLWVCPGG